MLGCAHLKYHKYPPAFSNDNVVAAISLTKGKITKVKPAYIEHGLFLCFLIGGCNALEKGVSIDIFQLEVLTYSEII